MKNKLFVGIATILLSVGLSGCASNGLTPNIGENGNWWIGDTDTEVPATGPAGKDGTDGTDGKDGVDGQDGTSITVVSVEKTKTEGNVDTYTITFSDETTTTFTVTNGESNVIESVELTDSSGLVDTYTITFSNGSTKTFNVTNGEDLTIVSVELKSSEGLIDTYIINYSDGSKFEFVVSNGKDGLTPYIGDNGNWWIGEKDTGVLADWEKANNVPLTMWSNGLTYQTMTLCGKTGFVVTGWDDDIFEDYLVYELIADGKTVQEAEEYMDEVEDEIENAHLVIPNYIGSIPVIGVWKNAHLNFKKVTLSRNSVWLGEAAFSGCRYLKEVEFNNSNITQIQEQTFKNTSVGNIKLPSSVRIIRDEAFSGVEMTEFDFTNVKYIGSKAFDSLHTRCVYLTKDIQYVGAAAFASTRVYLEHETYPSNWHTEITSSNDWNKRVSVNCQLEDNYIYSIDGDNVTVYQYLGSEKKIVVPSSFEEKPVTKIGYGFASLQYKSIDADSYEEIKKYIDIEEVVLPEGVKEIDDFALCNLALTIFAPSSLETVSVTLIAALVDLDDVIGVYLDAESNFLALKGENMPVVLDDGTHDPISGWTREYVESNSTRIVFGVDYSKVESDDNFYYVNDGESYSILSYKTLKGDSLVIPSTFNQKPVLSILSKAIGYDVTLKTIKIENGIVRIRPRGLCCSNIEILSIPISVLIINANGVVAKNNNMKIFVAAASKPVDWDTNWTNATDITYGIDGEIETNNFFVYMKKTDEITLISYLGNSSNIYIPSEINEKPVTTIKSGFYFRKGGAEIYIPSSVTKIDERAFVNTYNIQFDIHISASEKPAGWNENWYYNSYNSSNSYHVNKNWGESSEKFEYLYSEEYAYSVKDTKVTLLSFCGNIDIVKVPRKIDDKDVTNIKGYCFFFSKNATIYIPDEVETIEQYGFELNTGNYNGSLTIYCESASKPGGWNYYFAYNSYQQSTSGISIYYGRNIGY